MVTIEINNSFSTIKGLSEQHFKELRKVLSYNTDPQAAFFAGGNFPRVKYMIDVRGTFPSGLLTRVTEFLKITGVAYRNAELRSIPNKLVNNKANFKSLKPYVSQIEAADSAIAKGQGIISMTTGSGKSVVIALIASRINLRTLVVVPSVELKKQLTETIRGLFDDVSNITVENIDSKALQTKTDYDVLIIDESHHVAAKTYQKLNKTAWKGIYYRFFLTATPFRNKTEETLLFEGIAGQVIYRLPFHQAVKAGYVVPLEAFYYESPKQPTEAYTWAQVYSELVVNNNVKNKLIVDLLQNLEMAELATLCLVKEVAHGESLAALTGLPFANGKDEDSRKHIKAFNTGKIKVLIGTEGILGEGVDSKPCEYVIIAGAGKAKSAFMQKVGRCLRTYPGKESGKVILIKDRSHKFLLRHFNEQTKILKEEYGVTPIKLEGK